MSAKYICPSQIRKHTHPFLMCELLKKDDVDYNLRENAAQTACICQHYCPCTQRPENTAAYKACYESLKERKAETEKTVSEQEEEPISTEKPKRTKAKTKNEQ